MRGHIETLKFTIAAATAAIKAQQLVGFDDAPCGADAPVQGMARADTETGDPCTVTAVGVLELEAATAIAKGAKVYSDADGRTTAEGVENPFGTAIRAASAPGDTVTVLVR